MKRALSIGILMCGGIYLAYRHKPNFDHFMMRRKIKNEPSKGILYFIDSNTDSEFTKCWSVVDKDYFENPIIFCHLIRQVPADVQIKLIISTNGGNLDGCSRIITELKSHEAGYIVYISNESYSAGTLLALGAKEIVMDKHSYLSKIDSQITYNGHRYPSISFCSIDEKHIDASNIEKYKQSKFCNNFTLDVVNKALSEMSLDSLDIIMENLFYSQTLHCKRFNYDECRKMNLPVRLPNPTEKCFFSLQCAATAVHHL
jgi:hypothetical protein